MRSILFYLLAAVVLAGALNVLVQKRALYAALSLAVCLTGLAGVYFLLGAAFLGWIQLMVYAGAVMVLFVLTVMLVGPYSASAYRADRWAWRVQSVLLGLGLLVLTAYAAVSRFPAAAGSSADVDARAVGQLLFSRFLFPFELVSVLVLIALVGAVVLSRKRLPDDE